MLPYLAESWGRFRNRQCRTKRLAPTWTCHSDGASEMANSMSMRGDRYLPYALLAAAFIVVIVFRPLLPVDETRYLGVSWEMLLRGSFLVPTMNFEPYFQKPPLLFWLIDIAWAIFGVSRISAMLVIFLASSLVIHLTTRLARVLVPENEAISQRVAWLMLGNLVFLIYSSLVLFDMLLTAWVLAAVLAFIAFAKGGGLRFAALAGLFIGLGVLTKGPVVLIHVGWPLVLYPFWRDRNAGLAPGRFFAGAGLALLVALVAALLWLVPATWRMGGDFAHNLVWGQMAGRVTGSLQASHARPFYFYLLLLPLALVPWIAMPDLRRQKPLARWREGTGMAAEDRRALRFLALWGGGVLLTFSLIAGKQPHYIVPILPLAVIGFGYFMASVPLAAIRKVAIGGIVVFGVAHAIASVTLFSRYNLVPLADYVHERQDADWAFDGNYQAQFSFLARLEKPVTRLDAAMVEGWLASHPNGYVIRKFKEPPQASDGVSFSIPTEKGYYGVVPGRGVAPT